MSRAHRGLPALASLPLVLLLACGGGTDVHSVPPPNAGDGGNNAGSAYAQFDPANSIIPLPNILLTATTTSLSYAATPPLTPVPGTLNVSPGMPLTPDKAVSFLNLTEAGGLNSVSGLNAPIYIGFSAAVTPSTVNASTVKIFQIIPDSASASALENTTLGFHDVSAAFTYQILPSGQEIYAMPQVPLLPGARYIYVVTDGVKDVNGKSITASTTFGILKYVKGGATSLATDTTNLADNTDPNNPANIAGAAAAQLEQIASNVTNTGQIVLSGYRKTMWDLITNATTPVAKTGASATGIASRANISLMGRFITTSTGYTKPDPAGTTGITGASSFLFPVETSLWAWANNANVQAGSGNTVPVNFSTAETRAWTNGVSNFQLIATSAIPDNNAGSIGSVFGAIPHNFVGSVAWGSFEGASLAVDPYVTSTNLASAGGNLDAATPATNVLTTAPMGAYNPGTSLVPGTGAMMAFRNGTGNLRGWYHTTRQVPFVIIAPAAAPAGATYPVMIFMHGISRSKEDVLALANTACAAGYAVIAIDQAVHGFPAGATGSLTATGVTTPGGNGRPQNEWASNFFMLPSPLTARANIYQSAFNLWRLERILKQPAVDPSSLQAAMSGVGKVISTTGASQFVGQSLGSITGSVFLAGNSSQTGGSNMKALLSVPGGRLAWVLHDSPAFKATVDAGLAANGVPTNSAAYNEFFLLAQTVADSADPASMGLPLQGQAASRLANRLLVQEAVGDLVIPNTNGRYFVNALAGRTPQLGGDVSVGFTQVAPAASTNAAYVFNTSFTAFKAIVAPAAGVAVAPTQGIYQYGDTTTAATHGLLLDGSANTAAAQTQMARWFAVGLVTDGSVAYPIAPTPVASEGLALIPEHLKVYFPSAQQ
jgi:hypothetical protein